MTKMLASVCAVVALLAVERAAAAAVCVQVDTNRDNLPEQDRVGLKAVLEQTLAGQGQGPIASQNCTSTYTVSHVKLGNSMTVFLQGPQGYRQATARIIEDVPNLYSQMVKSLLTGQPMNTSNDTIDRNNVTAQQAAPTRAEADSLWFVRLGYAGVIGPSVGAGPSFGFGYRYELDSLGIEASFLNLVVGTDSSSNNNGSSNSGGVTGSWVKLMALYYANPIANGSTYFGGGVSWGGTAVVDNDTFYSGSGLQLEATAGYEFLRASTIRLFVEAAATLPLYSIKSVNLSFNGGMSKSSYAPTVGVSFGLGWGRGVTRVRLMQ